MGNCCTEVCLETIAKETKKLTGGSGLTVEVDESKFGRRKYNKGRLVEGQWVIGGICRETRDVFLAACPENKRDAATLVDIIKRHISKDLTVVTDCWRCISATGLGRLASSHHKPSVKLRRYVGLYE